MRFIYTDDIKVRDTLLSFGYKLLKCNSSTMWVFENNDAILLNNPAISTFAKINQDKIAFSDILTF